MQSEFTAFRPTGIASLYHKDHNHERAFNCFQKLWARRQYRREHSRVAATLLGRNFLCVSVFTRNGFSLPTLLWFAHVVPYRHCRHFVNAMDINWPDFVLFKSDQVNKRLWRQLSWHLTDNFIKFRIKCQIRLLPIKQLFAQDCACNVDTRCDSSAYNFPLRRRFSYVFDCSRVCGYLWLTTIALSTLVLTFGVLIFNWYYM